MRVFYKIKNKYVLELKCDCCNKGFKSEPEDGFYYEDDTGEKCRIQAEEDGWLMNGTDICCDCRSNPKWV